MSAQPLLSNGDFAAPLPGSWTWSGKAKTEPHIVDAQIDGEPITHAVQAEVEAAPGGNPWDGRLWATKSALAVRKGEMILVQFWGRSTPKTKIVAVYQQSASPFDKTIREVVSLLPTWHKYTFYSPAKTSYIANESNFEFWLGQSTGQVEIAGVRVENVGVLTADDAQKRFGDRTLDYYGGEVPDDNWIPAANARIEKYRKGDLKLRVVGKDGKPIAGAEVVLKETRSAFHWGTAVTPKMLEQSPDGEIYRSQLKRLFNTIVPANNLKWKASDNNPAGQKLAQDMLDWLHANGFAVRGHNLVWGSSRFMPDRLKSLSADDLRAEVEKRVKDTATKYKGQVYVWDAVNEAATETELWDKIGWQTFSDVYKWAKAADPDALMAYNDYNIANESPDNGSQRVKVEARIQRLIDAGAPVDVLGDQAHMSVPLTTIPRVLEIWDDWGKKYHKPVEVTEFDVGIPDDQVHAKYVHDFLIGAFSDPNIVSFLQWGFWEKDHWRGAAGTMFRADWSPRPAQLAYEDLVLNQWRTNQILKTDKNGIVQTRGFLGDYDVQINTSKGNKSLQLSLPKDGTKQQISLG